MNILLASKSPRRRELLSQIGVGYITADVDVPEQHNPTELPEAYVRRLAMDKSKAGSKVRPDLPSLGADTVVCCDDVIFEKPANLADCKRMLSMLSDRTHKVMTGVAVCFGGQQWVECSITEVKFRAISDNEIEAYWASGEPCDKAGAYAIQGLGAVFVTNLNGSYSGVVGLPIEIVSSMLSKLEIPIWNTAE